LLFLNASESNLAEDVTDDLRHYCEEGTNGNTNDESIILRACFSVKLVAGTALRACLNNATTRAYVCIAGDTINVLAGESANDGCGEDDRKEASTPDPHQLNI
jgi:hypothetical protein